MKVATAFFVILFACSLYGKYFLIETVDEPDHEQGGSGDNLALQHDYEDEETSEKSHSLSLTDHCKDHCLCELM